MVFCQCGSSSRFQIWSCSASFSGVVSMEEGFFLGGVPCFLARNSALLLEFLLWVDGLFLFFNKVDDPSPLVSKENVKEGPTLRVKLKICPLLASAWQKAMHWDAKLELSSPISGAAIFNYIWIRDFPQRAKRKYMLLPLTSFSDHCSYLPIVTTIWRVYKKTFSWWFSFKSAITARGFFSSGSPPFHLGFRFRGTCHHHHHEHVNGQDYERL